MPERIVTLTTDFGLEDHFVAAMKGVILSIAPRARLVDVTHQIRPYAIAEAAFTLAEAAGCFPKGTVHLVVVDPGVGTPRRALLAEAGGQYFVAPDNGVLTLALRPWPAKVREITAERFFRRPVSRTFHGRDVFAPVAAHLAQRAAPARFGRLIEDWVRGDFAEPEDLGGGRWKGCVLKVDRFGNLITNFDAQRFGGLRSGQFVLRAGRRRVTKRVAAFAEAPPGELVLLQGSSGFFEIAVNQASAAHRAGCQGGSALLLTLPPPPPAPASRRRAPASRRKSEGR